MATAVKEQQLVVAPSAMSNEHFRLHMNGRHEGEIGPENFTRLAEQAMDTPWVPRNPRPIGGPAQVREILELAA